MKIANFSSTCSGTPKFPDPGDSQNFNLSTTVAANTVASGISPREVIRCRHCFLVQFRTVSELCRRCDTPLPPPPRLEAEVNRALSGGRGDGARHPRFSEERFGQSEDIHSRSKTARELTIGRKLRE